MITKRTEWITLEQALDEAFDQGTEKDFLSVLRSLPPEKKEKYRAIWEQKQKERAGSVPKPKLCDHGISLEFRCWDCDPEEGRHD